MTGPTLSAAETDDAGRLALPGAVVTERRGSSRLLMRNGFILDARRLKREVQEEALRKGLIPYLPGEKPREVGSKEEGEQV
jgi:hypothetical protein